MARRNTNAMGFDWAFSSAYAAATVWHRLSWFGAAAVMTQAERQTEATRMFSEKVAAAYEGGWKAGLEAMRTMGGIALGAKPRATAPIAIADAAVRPALRKARANARRLNRRAVKPSRKYK
jgi:hypothetical protein